MVAGRRCLLLGGVEGPGLTRGDGAAARAADDDEEERVLYDVLVVLALLNTRLELGVPPLGRRQHA
eukprot:COSAG01_NODE_8302_length_2838_cov_17.727273_1_plen_65_part_10